MKNLLLLITILISMASCRSPQQIADRHCAKAQAKYEKAAYRWGCPLVQQTDSIVNTVVIRETHDTTIFVRIAADTVFSVDTLTILNGVAATDKSRLDTQYAFSIAYVHGSVLYHNLFQKESAIAATIKDAIQNNSKVEYKYITKTITETNNIITPWQWAQIWIGRILLLVLVMLLLLGVLLNVKGKFL